PCLPGGRRAFLWKPAGKDARAPRRLADLCRQQAFDVAHYTSHVFLIGEGHHNELVAVMKTYQPVTEQPDAREQRIPSKDDVDWKPCDRAASDGLSNQSCSSSDTERAQ